MENSIGQAEPKTNPGSSLDTISSSARKAETVPAEWLSPSKKRSHRAFHRILSGLRKDGEYRFLTLTTALESQNGAVQRDFRCLVLRLKRRGLLKAYIKVAEQTKSGLIHYHIIFRGSYIEQQWLSKQWEYLHHSPVVDIRRVGNRKATSAYLAKYCSKEGCGRLSWSWAWVYKGFCRDWIAFKRVFKVQGKTYQEMIGAWERYVRFPVWFARRQLKYLTAYWLPQYDFR